MIIKHDVEQSLQTSLGGGSDIILSQKGAVLAWLI